MKTCCIAGAFNRPALFPIPGWVMERILGKERATVVLQGQKVCPKRTLELGYNFRYPDLQSACGELARLQLTQEEKDGFLFK